MNRISLLLLLLVICAVSSAATYYISPSGNNTTGNGSSASPWQTLAYATSRVKTAGDLIYVNPGTYIENVQSVLAPGVSIQGAGNTSVIHSNITANETPTILLESAALGTNGNQSISYIRMVSDLDAYCAILVAARSNVSVHHCEFQNFFSKGVIFIGQTRWFEGEPSIYARGNKFYNNIITNCADYIGTGKFGNGNPNLGIGGQQDMLIYNNTIVQTDRGRDANGYPIKFVNGGYLKGVKIYDNTLTKPPYDGSTWDICVEIWHARGGIEIYRNNIQGAVDFGGNKSTTNDAGGYGYALRVYNNTIGHPVLRPNGENGIYLERGQQGGAYIYNNLFKNLSNPFQFAQGGADVFRDVYIYNNLVHGVGYAGRSNYGNAVEWMALSGSTGITYDNINFVNNTIISSPGSAANGLRFTFKGPARNVTIKNNIVQGFGYYGIYVENSNITNMYVENNNLYGNGSNAPYYTGCSLTNKVERNNRAVNPLFASTSDFHLQTSSTLIGAGVTTTLATTDYEGKTWRNPPSMGAFESGSGSVVTAAIPACQECAIENVSPSVIQMNYNLTLSTTPPPASAFRIMVNSVQRTVNSISVSGNKVLLTLASPVSAGNNVILDYTKPATNPIQTTSGGQAPSIVGEAVVNRVSASVPVLAGAAVESATQSRIDITYNMTLASILPAASAFTVTVNSAARTVSSVSVSGTKLYLNLSSPVVAGNTVTVAYTKPATNPLQNTAGGQAASYTSQAVINNLVAAVPAYVSSSVENVTPSRIDVTYNMTLASIVPAASAFSVTVNSVARTVSSVSVSGSRVYLTLSSTIAAGNTVTVAYNKPVTNPLQSTSGGQVATITAMSVTNNLSTPTISYSGSSIENTSPAWLEISFNSTLKNVVPSVSAFDVKVNSVTRSLLSVYVSGSKVFLNLPASVSGSDVITVAYNKPATNPIQTTSGAQATSFTEKPVTNRVASSGLNFTGSSIFNYSPAWIEVGFSTNLANVVPSVSSFVVKVNSVTRTILSAYISGSKIYLNLPFSVVAGNVITVAYTKPATRPIQTSTGLQAASFTEKTVTNNVTNTLSYKAAVESTSPSEITVVYNMTLASSVPPLSAFSVTVKNIRRTVTNVSVKDSVVSLTIDKDVLGGDSIIVAYTQPAQNGLKTTTDLLVPTTRIPVVNKVTGTSFLQKTTIYPNPAANFINVFVPGEKDNRKSVIEDASPRKVRIYDLSGRLHQEEELDSSNEKARIAINLTSGMYIVQILKGKSTIYSQKILVTK